MQGKRKNYTFVGAYIASNGADSQGNDGLSYQEIIQKAQTRIEEIDSVLKEIILLKKERSNLSDVVYILSKEQ